MVAIAPIKNTGDNLKFFNLMNLLNLPLLCASREYRSGFSCSGYPAEKLGLFAVSRGVLRNEINPNCRVEKLTSGWFLETIVAQ